DGNDCGVLPPAIGGAIGGVKPRVDGWPSTRNSSRTYLPDLSRRLARVDAWRGSAGALFHELAESEEGGPGGNVGQLGDLVAGAAGPVEHVGAGFLQALVGAQQLQRFGQQGVIGQVSLG